VIIGVDLSRNALPRVETQTGAGDEISGRRPLRVGLVIGQLTTGGAEGQLWLLCRGLDRARFTPVVYCLSDKTEPYGARIEATGTPVRIIAGSRLTRVRTLRRWLVADRIDLVHAWLFIANGFAWVANWSTAQPLITSARNCKQQGRMLNVLNRRAFQASSAIVVNSNDVGTYIADRYSAPQDRIRVIYNGVDTERFHPDSSADDEASGIVGPIVSIGRLVPQKNHELFLQAARQLSDEISAVRFVIVGDGPLRATLTERARALGIAERVSFVGERADVEDILRSASLLWLPSRTEGLANVVLEALASGVPTIATDVGGTCELIRTGVEGFVVPQEDAAAFAQRSRNILLDSSMRRRFRRAARARAEQFSIARMVAACAQLYGEVSASTN
jgi:glycosyltransferase involved in cell wall biosynthesis